MTTHNRWLDVLQNATSYSELQNVFSEMALEASSTDNAPALAASIDEAIRRIEQERDRDEAQLDDVTSKYDSFKQQQSGVVGWFKRKLPFTETRKQELGHLGALSDQKAEVLADNFVIARAQMLKEKILQAPLRHMGNRPKDWQERFLQHDSVQGVQPFGTIATELGNALIQSKAFIESIRVEIDAFSTAGFSEKEDRSRRDTDLLAARGELKLLENEDREKQVMRSNAIKRLGALIQTDLIATDPSFRTISQQVAQLNEVVRQVLRVQKHVEVRQSSLAILVDKFAEIGLIQERRATLELSTSSLRRDFENVEYRRSRAAKDLEEPSNAYNAAVREVNQAVVSLNIAKSNYDAYLAAQGTAETTTEFDYGATSTSEAEYERHKRIADQANEGLKRTTLVLENAKRHLTQVTQEADSILKKLEQQAKEMDLLPEKEVQNKKTLASVYENLTRNDPDFRNAIQSYSNLIAKVSWMENHSLLVGVPSEVFFPGTNQDILPPSPSWPRLPGVSHKSREQTEFEQLSTATDRFAKTFKADGATLQKAYSKLIAARNEVLQQRCRSRLDPKLASEVVFED